MYENFLSWYPGYLEMLAVVGFLVALNWIAGIAAAVVGKKFQWKYVADILGKWLLPILGWTLFDAIQIVPTKFSGSLITDGAGYLAYITLITAMGAALIANIQVLGIPVDLSKVGIPPSDKNDSVVVARDVTMLDLKEGLK